MQHIRECWKWCRSFYSIQRAKWKRMEKKLFAYINRDKVIYYIWMKIKSTRWNQGSYTEWLRRFLWNSIDDWNFKINWNRIKLGHISKTAVLIAKITNSSVKNFRHGMWCCIWKCHLSQYIRFCFFLPFKNRHFNSVLT